MKNMKFLIFEVNKYLQVYQDLLCCYSSILNIFLYVCKSLMYYSCIDYKRNKEINKTLSENDHTMIESTFYYTEVNFWTIEGSLCVSDTALVYPQWSWSQTESDVGKPSESNV